MLDSSNKQQRPHPQRRLSKWCLGYALCALAVLGGCQSDDDPPPQETRTQTKPIEAVCAARVVYPSQNREVLADVEDDYLPRVIACENGNADFQALKAQAVAARSYLYYRMDLTGSIEDGQQDQVFTCSRPPSDRHYLAAAETAGEVLLNDDGNVIAAFYVAGAIPSTASCVPANGDSDPTTTERFVTYNWGKSGDNVTPSPLGHPASPFNRGCKSQNGAHCLAGEGWDYKDILRFYYGMDIQIVPAEGACLAPFRCPTLAPDSPTVVSEQGSCFTKFCNVGNSWYTDPSGDDGEATYTFTIDTPAPQCWGRWMLQPQQSGRYRIEAYIQDIGPLSTQAPYKIKHAGGAENIVRIAQEGEAGWVKLAVVELDANAEQWVELYDNTGEPYTGLNGTRILFDALRVMPTPESLTDFNELPPEDIGPSDTSSGTDIFVGSDTTTQTTTDTHSGTDIFVNADTTTTTDTANAADTSNTTNTTNADTASTAEDLTGGTQAAFKAAEGDDCACDAVRKNNKESGPWSLGLMLGFALLVWRRRR